MTKQQVQQVLNLKGAFCRTFLRDGGDLQQDAQLVLAHLKRFCRAHVCTLQISPKTCMMDPLASAAAEGRREVWLEIQKFLYVDEQTIFRLEETINE